MQNKKTIAVNAELHTRIKIIAAERNCSMELIIEQLVMKHLGLESVSR